MRAAVLLLDAGMRHGLHDLTLCQNEEQHRRDKQDHGGCHGHALTGDARGCCLLNDGRQRFQGFVFFMQCVHIRILSPDG